MSSFTTNRKVLQPRFFARKHRKLHELVKHFCVDLDISLAFSFFKIRNMFSVKEEIDNSLVQDVIRATSGTHFDAHS